MEDKQISDFAAQLETAIHSEDVFVKMVQHGGGPDESHIRANRAGYLRLASLFLRAAIAPCTTDNYPDIVDVDASSVIHEDSDIFFDRLERSEDIEQPPEGNPSFFNTIVSIGCAGIGILLCYILIVGVTTVFGWIFLPR